MSKNGQSLTVNRGKGFTLIELLVVIAIISVLAGLLVSNFVGVRQRGRDAERKSDLRQIQSALELYRSDNGNYPAVLYSISCPTSGSLTHNAITYMQKIPCDPSDDTNYPFSSTGITYTVYACLENTNDQDRDANDGQAGDLCTAQGRVSYTLTNP
jgi:general secretion pathway protein G